MKVVLAEKLLAKIMGWSIEEVSIERPLLQAMANLKYDEYQQYSPGIRFIESLAQWLAQFENTEERQIMYDFIKNNLIFISSDQMAHLVNLSFSTIINPILIEKSATLLNEKKYMIRRITSSDSYKKNLRQSLFIGLSDGSRIDQLRRSASLNNEQVLTTYYIDNEKIVDMKKELEESKCQKFTSIFLIDDFTASGTSYARFEKDDIPKGKILKLLNKIYKKEEDKPKSNDKANFRDLIESEKLSIHIVFYLATEDAISNIKSAIDKYQAIYHLQEKDLKISIDAIQLITSEIKEKVISDTEFISIIKKEKYFDDNIIDSHYQKGKHEKPFLGFNECALPLVLSHNSPNNSIPILWLSEDEKFKGLFPRVKRHKE